VEVVKVLSVYDFSIAVFYTLGTLILPWLAVWVGNWQIYGLAIALPMLLGLLAIFFVPESARWLLSKGRTAEATNILRSFAKVNKKQVDESVFVNFEVSSNSKVLLENPNPLNIVPYFLFVILKKEAKALFDGMQDEEEQSFTTALKTPRLRRTFILLVMIWYSLQLGSFKLQSCLSEIVLYSIWHSTSYLIIIIRSIIALVYDGHSRNILNLANEQQDVFVMFTIASMTEFPADVLLIFTLDRFGRRWLSFGALTLSGAASIIAAAVPRDSNLISTSIELSQS
jgi:MFS family permease